ncbi:MAG: hypothetical protein AW07_04128 [Candidatus Accumulibacter sp. SK-11]|nr:MAG: hypothetical protein AW07_04128 [Candidatus Accumulibacter sp. SK-11]
MQRHRLTGRLAQRRRQGGSDADQIGVHQDIDIALAHPDLCAIAGPARDAGEHGRVDVPSQIIDHQGTTRQHPHLAFLAAAGDSQRTAEQPGIDLGNAQIGRRELQAALHLLQRRQQGIDDDLVALKRVGAVDLRLAKPRLLERNHQRDVQSSRPPGAHLLGEMVDLRCHRAPVDELEELGRRPGDLTLELERAHRRIEIRDLGARLRQRRTEDRAAPRLYHHAVALEAQVGVDAADQRPAGTVVEDDILRLDGDEKLSLLAVEKGEVRQIALEDQPRFAGAPLLQRIAQPVPGIDVDRCRQVAPDGGRFGTCQRCRQVDAARSVWTAAVGSLRRTGSVGAGKVGARQFDLDAALVDLPLRLRIQGFEDNRRLGKDLRQLDAHLPRTQLHGAALLARIERAGEAAGAWEVACRLQRQVREGSLQRIRLQFVGAAPPTGAQFADPTTRRKLVEQSARLRIERQVGCQSADDPEVEHAGGRTAAHQAALGLLLLPFEMEISRLDAQLGHPRRLPGHRSSSAVDGRRRHQ